ncbi:MAG: CRTAC1 family protein [Acidimicrobiia bacterium]|nr:CRTAC1 family protein [Acidimicrobiia bacterium]
MSSRRTWAVGGAVAITALVGGWAALSGGGGATPDTAFGPPRLVDETSAAGIDHVYDGDFTFYVGGGVAVFDCNGDTLPDIYFAGGENPASLYRNQSEPGGALSFAKVSGETTDIGQVTGAYPVNIDGDEHADLVVLRLGENVVLRGLGDCQFERANEAWSMPGGDAWTVGFSTTWEGDSLRPTLAFGNYLHLDEAGQQFGGCADNALLRPDIDGYQETLLAPGWCTLSILFSDWDRSGSRDLRMTNDRHYYRDGEEQLWRVVEGEAPRLYTRQEGWHKMQIWGMGIASQDVTGDGLPEVFLTSQADNKLQTLEEGADGPSYGDIAIRRGVTAHRPFTGDEVSPSTAWHPEFQDVNNDGFVDLFVTKGNVEATVGYATADPNNLLLGQPDGTFVEGAEGAGILDTARSRGGALADFNLDGLLDLVYVNRREGSRLWRNLGSDEAGHWLSIDLQQGDGNRNAIGAWIEVMAGDHLITRELTIGGGHAGGQLGSTHFGLGPAEEAEIRVQWPDGETTAWMTVGADQFVTLERGAAQPETILEPNR